MIHLKKTLGLTIALCLTGSAFAQSSNGAPAPASSAQVSSSADNTKMNARDRDGAMATPQTQDNQATNRSVLAAVRKAIVKDKTLSTLAHNVKVMVQGGVVTLRGPVKSDAEKTSVESVAKQVAGVNSVDNQLDIKLK